MKEIFEAIEKESETNDFGFSKEESKVFRVIKEKKYQDIKKKYLEGKA